MKQLALFLLSLYQNYISILLRQLVGTSTVCRYSPTCSEYAKQSIMRFGVIKGGYLSFFRLLSCQPWVTFKRASSRLA